MIVPAHYRSLLAPDEQDTYKDIVNGLLRRRETILIKQTADQAKIICKIVDAVHLDHPELFYVDFWHYQLGQIILPFGSSIRFRMMLDKDPSVAVMNTLNEKAASLRIKMKANTSREQAYCSVAKEIASSVTYADSNNAFWDHTAAGPVLRHRAVCEGISKLFLFLCQRLGLPCAIITGTLNGTPHAWNMIEINGVRRFIDVTGFLQTIPFCAIVPMALFRSEQWLRRNGYRWENAAVFEREALSFTVSGGETNQESRK